MNKELGTNMIRSFKFLMVTTNITTKDETTILKELNELGVLFKKSASKTKIDNVLFDIITSFKEYDLENEAYEIIRDTIKIQDSGVHKVFDAINDVNRSLNTVCENMEMLVSVQKNITNELISNNSIKELETMSGYIYDAGQVLQGIKGSIDMIANEKIDL